MTRYLEERAPAVAASSWACMLLTYLTHRVQLKGRYIKVR